MRIRRHAAGALLAMVLAWGFSAVPAEATVHEIVAQWCSGRGELAPPGISQPNSNFARPLNAVGVVRQEFLPDLNIILVTFDFDHPAVKVQSSGAMIQIGVTPDGIPIMLDVPEPNPDFPAFQHCPRLASH